MWSHVLSCQWTSFDLLPSQSLLVLSPTLKPCHMIKILNKRNSYGVPLLENSPQKEGMRRIIYKRRKWWEPSVFGVRKEYSTKGATVEVSSKGIPQEFLFWLTPQEKEIRRMFHFHWIKGVLLLRSTSGKQIGFSCWVVHQILPKLKKNTN